MELEGLIGKLDDVRAFIKITLLSGVSVLASGYISPKSDTN